jgi:hypothetical protein
MTSELQQDASVFGVTVQRLVISEARYAPEIAPQMLMKQQAAAMVAARREIVAGAMAIVRDTLAEVRRDVVAWPMRRACGDGRLGLKSIAGGHIRPHEASFTASLHHPRAVPDGLRHDQGAPHLLADDHAHLAPAGDADYLAGSVRGALAGCAALAHPSGSRTFARKRTGATAHVR